MTAVLLAAKARVRGRVPWLPPLVRRVTDRPADLAAAVAVAAVVGVVATRLLHLGGWSTFGVAVGMAVLGYLHPLWLDLFVSDPSDPDREATS